MPRRGNAEGQYRSPRKSPDRDEILNTTLRQAQNNSNIGMPVRFHDRVPTRLPIDNIKWAREVDYVLPNAGRARDFLGRYVEGHADHVQPGSVLLICDEKDKKLSTWIHLPLNTWYDTAFGRVPWAAGWAQVMRRHINSWVILSRAQRVVRACRSAFIALDAATETVSNGNTRLRDSFESTRELYDRILNAVFDGVTPDSTPHQVRMHFTNALNEIALWTSLTNEEALGIVEPVLFQSLMGTHRAELNHVCDDLGISMSNDDGSMSSLQLLEGLRDLRERLITAAPLRPVKPGLPKERKPRKIVIRKRD
jgi:hypothetical protein